MKEELLKQVEDNKKVFAISKKKIKDNNDIINEYFRIKLTYSANAITGNELSMDEAKLVISNGEFIKGKSVKDYYEVLGFSNAFSQMIKSYKRSFSENSIKKLHSLFYSGINDKKSGKYRDLQVYNSEFGFMPPSGDDISQLMQHYILQLESSKLAMNTIEYAVMSHRRILEIQPFVDGNLQIALMIMNMILLEQGYGYIVITPEKKDEYVKAFKLSVKKDNPDMDTLIDFITECLCDTQKDLMKIAGIL